MRIVMCSLLSRRVGAIGTLFRGIAQYIKFTYYLLVGRLNYCLSCNACVVADVSVFVYGYVALRTDTDGRCLTYNIV